MTAVAFAADDTGLRLFGDHETNIFAALTVYARGVGSNGHVRGYRCDAGGHQAPGFFIFHQA